MTSAFLNKITKIESNVLKVRLVSVEETLDTFFCCLTSRLDFKYKTRYFTQVLLLLIPLAK